VEPGHVLPTQSLELILTFHLLDMQLTAVFHYPHDSKVIVRQAVDDAFQAVRIYGDSPNHSRAEADIEFQHLN